MFQGSNNEEIDPVEPGKATMDEREKTVSDGKKLDRIERVVEHNAKGIAALGDRVDEITASVDKLVNSVARMEKKIDSATERLEERLDLGFARLEKNLSRKIIAGYIVGGTIAGILMMVILLP